MGDLHDTELDDGPRIDDRPIRVLSSPLTFIEKFGLLPVSATFTVIVLIVCMLDLGWAKLTNEQKLIASLMPALMSLGIYRISVPVKRVKLTSEGLLVSNYKVEILVPFGSIRAIETHRRANCPVKVHLNEDTPFGRNFTFRPDGGQNWWRESPVVIELRGLVESSFKS